ncbi:MAG: ParB/RepB/Spo0J family partition protein [Candidatus Sericytochromatia bacterium]
MAKKDFSSVLNTSTKQKEEVNLKIENQRLKDIIKDLKLKTSNENINLLKISEVKLNTNIRDNYEYEEIKELSQDISKNGQLQPVLITKDNYLIAGYRRYHAIKHIDEDSEILVNRLNKSNDQIDESELKKIQYIENNERRAIDNFQLSSLFNWYLEKGYSQKEISEKFNKSKGIVSVIIAIKNLDNTLVDYIKQFQTYGVSYKKFVSTNSEEKEKFLENREIIGYRPIYDIAKLEVKEQKKLFLKKYFNKLTKEELESKFFKDAYKELNKPVNNLEKTIKSITSIKNTLEKAKKNLSSEQIENFNSAIKYLNKIEALLVKK